jgi:peroxiredoxin
MTAATVEPQVGGTAPAFRATTTDGEVTQATYQGRQHLVLYFMRTFDCPVCLGHVMRLARTAAQLETHHTAVLVLGPGEIDEAEALRRRLPFPVAADPDRHIYQTFGLGQSIGIQQSGTALIDREGTLRYLNRSTLPFGALKEPALLAAIGQAEAAVDST